MFLFPLSSAHCTTRNTTPGRALRKINYNLIRFFLEKQKKVLKLKS